MIPSRSILYVIRDWVVDSVEVMQAKLRLRNHEEERVLVVSKRLKRGMASNSLL